MTEDVRLIWEVVYKGEGAEVCPDLIVDRLKKFKGVIAGQPEIVVKPVGILERAALSEGDVD